MTDVLRPIYCLADSQLLFWRPEPDGDPWLRSLLQHLPDDRPPRAAYVGASNGDDPAFYAIFEAAMDGLGIDDRRMILSAFPTEDRTHLESADLIVLAGGDPVQGWRIFSQSGMDEVLRARAFAGAVLLGVSAGAVQLGWVIDPPAPAPGAGANGATAHASARSAEAIQAFRLVPAIIGVHEEDEDWAPLRRRVADSGLQVRGLGIPSGGGLAYHPDQTVEPIRRPVHELWFDEEDRSPKQGLLLPGEIHCHEDGAAHTEK